MTRPSLLPALLAAVLWQGIPPPAAADPPAATPPATAGRDAGEEPDGAREAPGRGGGAWWRSPEAVRSLRLTTEQAGRLDEIFRTERRRLIDLRAEVEKAQLDLEETLSREPFDEAAARPAADRFEAKRSELARARTLMLVRMRGVLTREQYETLRDRFRERIGRGPRDRHGR